MSALITDARHFGARPTAELNRERLREAGVFTVNVVGGPGCGKTSLIDATIGRLRPDVRVGVVACDVTSHRDAHRLTGRCRQVVQVNTGLGGHGPPEAGDISAALERLPLAAIDLLLIENVGSLLGPVTTDLGQDVTAAVFSVAGGHDKAEKHAELVAAGSVVVLNKTDLMPSVPFDLHAFRADVRRLNRLAPLYELSALQGRGMEPWLAWLKSHIGTRDAVASGWFG